MMTKLFLNTALDQLDAYVKDQRLIAHIQNGQVNKFERYDQINLMSFDWYDIRNGTTPPAQIIIIFTQEYTVFICEGETCFRFVQQLIGDVSLDQNRVLYTFFSELTKNDIDYLENLEERIAETEEQMLTRYSRDRAGDIISLRRELLNLKKYYEQLTQIFDGLTENENELISIENLRYFRIVDNKIERIYKNVLNLRDYVTQVREAYQAQIDIEQNSLMKIFTVISAIFMPLTLIVGWYGMNLKMPEYSLGFVYPVVIVLSIMVVIFSIIFFKHRKWL